jgi:predicted ArsR family transcriptional regulator
MQETFKIKDLEQIRLLSDPFKLQLLQAFAEGDKTTKQVAAELGESITKLYRHVDALHDAGLLEIAGEKQKRGTVERTFRAVAQRFEADHSLFTEEGGGEGAMAARDMLRASEDEILNAINRADHGKDTEAIMMRLRCKASPQRIAELRDSLNEWIESTQAENDCDDGNARGFGALIAFYPLTNDNSDS